MALRASAIIGQVPPGPARAAMIGRMRADLAPFGGVSVCAPAFWDAEPGAAAPAAAVAWLRALVAAAWPD